MSKQAPFIVLTLAAAVLLTACAHQRQPRARCTGPLERINVTAPAVGDDNRAAPPDASEDQPPEEESAP